MSADARAEAERLPGDGAWQHYREQFEGHFASSPDAHHAFAAGWDARRRWQASRPVTDAEVDTVRRICDQHFLAPNTNPNVIRCACGDTWDATAEGWREFYRHGTRAALEAAREVSE